MNPENLYKMNAKDYLSSIYKGRSAYLIYLEWLDFENYLKSVQRMPENTDYSLILDYVASLQERNQNPLSINRKLRTIEKVFGGLKLIEPNPVRGLRLKNAQDKPLPEPIDYELLSQYLSDFPTETPMQFRNKLVLSLIHHQALRASEIKKLTIKDVHINKAQIEVSSIFRSNYRVLEVTALQLLDLQVYLSEIRPKFTPQTELLFPGFNGVGDCHNSLMSLKKQLQQNLPKLQNLEHWRSSIIVHWLENQSILEVQQKIGHRYPSSTERYKIHAIKSLQEELNLHHPLR